MKPQWLDRSLLACPYYCLALNEKQFHKLLKHLHIPPNQYPPFLLNTYAHATAHHFEKPDKSIATIVCLGDTTGRELSVICGLLIHEAVHIWQEYKKFIGEHSPSSEFEAYSIQWIAQQLIAEYMRLTK